MRTIERLDLETVRKLIDFGGGRVSRAVARDQEMGATAIHNILVDRAHAYLADEVGMGKTYVALGVVGLLRFFHPGIRVLVITPRHNIQAKWGRELRNFVRNNWRSSDQRVRGFDGQPAVPVIQPGSLLEWARQCVVDPERDVVLRMSSFGWALQNDGGPSGTWREQRERIERLAPVLRGHFVDPTDRDKSRFKARAALAVNALLPHYDLVVIDESHHFKHGRASQSARNRMLAITLGAHPPRDVGVDIEPGPLFERRFDRLLCLSATPVEEDFRQLFNQLDLLGLAGPSADLRPLDDPKASDADKRTLARRFLVRRLTTLAVDGGSWTRNMYRREWREGGMARFDEPMKIPGVRQRLIVALVQRKLATLLNRETSGRRFQIGMLASFESFEESARPVSAETADSAFDDADQTEDVEQRRGVDRALVAEIADSYRKTFGASLPHPKMDAVVASLSNAFAESNKALVFVRRVKSVPELVFKLGDGYDAWLQGYLEALLPPSLHGAMRKVWAAYHAERREKLHAGGLNDEASDQANDTFFAWFFQSQTHRGDLLTGTKFRENRLMESSSTYSTLFEDDYLGAMFGFPANLLDTLASEVGRPSETVREQLLAEASHRLARWSKPGRLHNHHAVQEAGLRLLAKSKSPRADEARTMASDLYGPPPSRLRVPRVVAIDVDAYLGATTFFTELRKRPALQRALWPVEDAWAGRTAFRSRELRRELLAATVRLGHSMVDLYALAVADAGTLEMGGSRLQDDRSARLITAFLDRLESLRGVEGLHAYSEMSSVGRHHEHILAVNFSDAREVPLSELRTYFGTALGNQVPIAGMHGRATERAVRHFRMPGYPMVLVSTDVLQEGEDLHSFCSRIVHYGVSWTPSSMEQRTGRIDRIGSQVHRRLEGGEGTPSDDALLQVHFPHLRETVEREQVRVVLERMNRFMELMHTGLAAESHDPTVDVAAEALRRPPLVGSVRAQLSTAFPVTDDMLQASLDDRSVDTEINAAQSVGEALQALFGKVVATLRGIDWDPMDEEFRATGRAAFDFGSLGPNGKRPFSVFLSPNPGGRETLLVATCEVRSVSDDPTEVRRMEDLQRRLPHARLCLAPARSAREHRLVAESAILFDPAVTQAVEVRDLIDSVVRSAELADAEWDGAAFDTTVGGRDHKGTKSKDVDLTALVDSFRAQPTCSIQLCDRTTFRVHFASAQPLGSDESGWGRSQVVRYELAEGFLLLSSTACAQATLEARWSSHRLGRRLLEWNRNSGTAAFRVSHEQNIEAWSAHRLETLQPVELQHYIVSVARAADRAEFVLTGEDRF